MSEPGTLHKLPKSPLQFCVIREYHGHQMPEIKCGKPAAVLVRMMDGSLQPQCAKCGLGQ